MIVSRCSKLVCTIHVGISQFNSEHLLIEINRRASAGKESNGSLSALVCDKKSSRAISRVLCANLRRCRNAGFGLLARLSFIWTCRRRQAQSFYPPSRTLKCSDEPPSDDGIRELSTPDVHSPYCHQMAGGLLHTPSHPYRPKPAVVFFCTD